MTLTQLKYAITVSEAGSMNQAAKELFISQPSLSLAIRDLEEEIGVELFRRSSRGILLTPDGEEFIGYAKQVVEQYQLIESKYVQKEKVKKKFSVSMQHYTFAVNAFVEMVKQFGMDEYEFAVHETKTYEVIEDVRTFRSEISIIWNSMKFCGVVYMYICGKDIRLQIKKKLIWKNWRSIRACPLSREVTIPFILQRKF